MLPAMKRYWLQPVLCVAVCTLLGACEGGDVRDTLGLDKEAPDEFKVVSRPPLSVPPEFDLRPPEPGAPPRASATSATQARKLILQDEDDGNYHSTLDLDGYEPASETAVDPVIAEEAPSPAQSSFLTHLGVDHADPEIRSKLVHDSKKAPPVSQEEALTPLEKLLGATPSDPVVDAKAEAKRIRKNKDAGKPVSEGEVKVLDHKKGNILDRVF